MGDVLQTGCDKLQFCPARLKASCHRVLGSPEEWYKTLSTLKNDILELLVYSQLSFISHTEPMLSATGYCSAKLFGSVLQLFFYSPRAVQYQGKDLEMKLLFHWETLIALFHKHSAVR